MNMTTIKKITKTPYRMRHSELIKEYDKIKIGDVVLMSITRSYSGGMICEHIVSTGYFEVVDVTPETEYFQEEIKFKLITGDDYYITLAKKQEPDPQLCDWVKVVESPDTPNGILYHLKGSVNEQTCTTHA